MLKLQAPCGTRPTNCGHIKRRKFKCQELARNSKQIERIVSVISIYEAFIFGILKFGFSDQAHCHNRYQPGSPSGIGLPERADQTPLR